MSQGALWRGGKGRCGSRSFRSTQRRHAWRLNGTDHARDLVAASVRVDMRRRSPSTDQRFALLHSWFDRNFQHVHAPQLLITLASHLGSESSPPPERLTARHDESSNTELPRRRNARRAAGTFGCVSDDGGVLGALRQIHLFSSVAKIDSGTDRKTRLTATEDAEPGYSSFRGSNCASRCEVRDHHTSSCSEFERLSKN